MKEERPLGHHRVLTAPNALTALRLFAVPVVVLLVLAREDAFAALVFVLAAATDFLDGRWRAGTGGSGSPLWARSSTRSRIG